LDFILSIVRTASRPPPSMASDTAVVSIIAMVIVMFRRRPVITSLKTKLARMSGAGPWGRGRAGVGGQRPMP
jgi:hypothetical protein